MSTADTIRLLRQRVPVDHVVLGVDWAPETQRALVEAIQLFILPYNPFYARLFLQRYINAAESANVEINEEVYETYCSETVLYSRTLSPTDADILSYKVSRDVEVSIKEAPRLISGSGTTGLRTWEAALYLATYLSSQSHLCNKTVLELGTGTGLVGLSLVKSPHVQLKRMMFTDGDSQLLDNLGPTLELNGAKRSNVVCQQLLWGTTDPTNPEAYIQPTPSQVDYVIGADITYDALVVGKLCNTISDFFKLGATTAIIAATVRNPDTIRAWETQCNTWFSAAHWEVIDSCLEPTSLQGFIWYPPSTPEIRIYQITTPCPA